MTRFHVTIRTPRGPVAYSAIAASSFDLHDAAVERFGPCSITVVPA